jgi:hypothetical protein
VNKATAEKILGAIDEQDFWLQMLASNDRKVALDAAKYLTNRRDGLPAQSVQMAVTENRPVRILWHGPQPSWAIPVPETKPN